MVLLPNTRLGVRRRVDAEVRNAHGERVPTGWGPVAGDTAGVLPDGRTNEQVDGSWTLGVDPSCWPVRQGDLVISDDGWSWLVTSANLITNNYDSTVNWVRVAAQRRSGGDTVPPGAWFIARYLPSVDPTPTPVPDDGVVLREPGLWTGNGPPPLYDFGAAAGDEYMDLLTGTVYELRGSP